MGKVLKIGLIGCGRLGRLHAENIHNSVSEAEIVLAADLFMNDDMAAWANSAGIPETTNDPDKLIASEKVEAVFICSSANTHSEYIIKAAEAGKDIFCEKPIHTDIPGIQAALTAVEKAGVKLQIGFNRRFDPSHRKVHEAVASGELGRPYVVKITSRDSIGPTMVYVKNSGGLFFDMMIHDFDMARYVIGSDIEEVNVIGAVLTDQRYADYDDIDTAIVTMKFANGALGVADGCRTAPYGYDQRVEVHCKEGCVQDTNILNHTAVISTSEGVISSKPKWFFLERYTQAFIDEEKAFVDSVLHDTEIQVTGYDGLVSVKAAIAAGISLREGRPVKLSEITASAGIGNN